MFRMELPKGNGWTRALTYLILIGYAVLILCVIVFVIVTTVKEINSGIF